MTGAGAPDPGAGAAPAGAARGRNVRLGVLLAVVAAVAVYLRFGDVLSLAAVAEQEAALRAYQQAHPWPVYGAAFLVYVAVAGLSLPGATALTLVFAWYFDFARAFVLVSSASTAGASLAFLLSRYVFRDAVRSRFGPRLRAFDEALARDGALYLFTLRLVPGVPFFVINLVMGLTPLRLRTFWWVSQVGMLPGTAVYVYAGSAAPDLQVLGERGLGGIVSPQLLAAFALLGVFPLLARALARRFRAHNCVDRPSGPTRM